MEKATSVKNATRRQDLKANEVPQPHIVVTAKPPLLFIHNMNSNVFTIQNFRSTQTLFCFHSHQKAIIFIVYGESTTYFDRCAKNKIMIAIQYEYMLCKHTKI